MAEPSPSPFLAAHAAALRASAARGPALDLACGRGRHALAAGRMGVPCAGMDRDAGALDTLAARARAEALPVQPVRTDLETPHGIPVRDGACGAVLIFRYLHRPLAGAIVRALAPGGLLLYETFTLRQRDLPYGPGNPAFLLEEGELPRLFAALEPIAYAEGPVEHDGRTWHLASLVARRA